MEKNWGDTPSATLSVTLYIYVDILLAKYTEVKYQLKQFFYTSFRFDKLFSEIDNVLQKTGEFNLIMSA